ncbi:MAG: pilus assembly protein [Chloroflexi bacterium]|nr:pilus assembly protein [Chloroflexota bacterium]
MVGVLHRKNSRAQSVIEFALVLPFLILLLAGVVDFANAFRIYIALTNAAREGAYYAALPDGTSATVCSRVQESLSGTLTVACGDVTVSYPALSGTITCAGGSAAAGCPVRVAVAYSLTPYFAGIIGFSTIPLMGQADMMVLTTGN